MRVIVLFICVLNLSPSLLWSQKDTLKYLSILYPADTLNFDQIYLGIFEQIPPSYQNETQESSKFLRSYKLIDSVPGIGVSLYKTSVNSAKGTEEYILVHETEGAYVVSGFTSMMEVEFKGVELLGNDSTHIIELAYTEHEKATNGSIELDVKAYYLLDGYCVPLCRVVERLWHSEHGNYEAKCKDFQYFSVEFSREVDFVDERLLIDKGHYKYSNNIECETFRTKQAVYARSYPLKDYLLIATKPSKDTK